MRDTLIALGLLAALAGAACGTTETERKVEEAAKGAEQAAKGLEQMAKSLEQMAGGGGEGKTVEPVNFRELQTTFGDLDGWEKGKPTGERMSMPVNFSQAQVVYRKGDARIEAKIVDSGFHQLLMAPYAMFLTAGYEKETESGYEKSVSVEGHPGWEEWNSERKDGQLNAVVNKRFLVTFDGNGIESPEVLHQLARQTDLQKLAGMQ
jgi:hypothetical protein